MQHSEQIDQIAAALVAAQAALKPVQKNGRNPHFRTTYSTFDDIMTAAASALKTNGLAVMQHPAPAEPGTLALETRILHESGQWVAGTLTMPLAKADPQGYGSAMTYARRYGLQAILGISGMDDDDGEGAMPAPPRKAVARANGNGADRAPVKITQPPDLSDDEAIIWNMAADSFRGFVAANVDGYNAPQHVENAMVALGKSGDITRDDYKLATPQARLNVYRALVARKEPAND